MTLVYHGILRIMKMCDKGATLPGMNHQQRATHTVRFKVHIGEFTPTGAKIYSRPQYGRFCDQCLYDMLEQPRIVVLKYKRLQEDIENELASIH